MTTTSKHIDSLDALLNESKQLIATPSRLPTIRPPTISHVPKNLQSIYHQSKKLNQKVARTVTDTAPKGDLLLAQKGFDVERYRRGLHVLDLKSAFEPLEPLGETDIDAYLKHQHSMIMLTAIEEAKKSTSNQFYIHYDTQLDNDWKSAKKQLQQILSQHKSTSAVAKADYELGRDRHPMSTYQSVPYSTNGLEQAPYTPGKRGRTKMDNRMIEYSSVVYELNVATKRSDEFQLISKFIRYAEQIVERESRKRDVITSWKVLKYLMNETSSDGVLDRQITEEDMLEGAKAALAAQYAEFVADVVAAHSPKVFEEMKQMNPSVHEELLLVQRYLNIIRNKDRSNFDREVVIVNDQPVWAIIYYCLRCGFVKQAIQYAEQSQIVRESLLFDLIRDLPQRQSRVSQNELNSEYRTTSGTDIFKKALYLLLGKCEMFNSFTRVFSKTEDWIWYKLHLVDKTNYTLATLQEKITEYGPQYFCGDTQSLKYFRLLLYTQQFEKAIEYLCGRTLVGYQVEAVHFAIALYYYRQLKISQNPSAPLLSSTAETNNQSVQLNFYFLLHDYVKLFAHTDPRDAVSYYSILAIPYLKNEHTQQASKDKQMSLQYLIELVVDSKDVSTLLGTINSDGMRKKGCIEDFLPSEDLLFILERSAVEYQRIGRNNVAVELYFMAEEHIGLSSTTLHPKSSQYLTNILLIVNDELSQVLTSGDNRAMVIQLASKVNMKFVRGHLRGRMREADKQHFDTFSLLLRLISFFNLYDAKKYYEAYDLIAKAGIIPFQRERIDTAVKIFNSLDETIQRKMSDIISTCMNILYNLYLQEKAKASAVSSSVQQTEIRHRANTLLTFAGYIQNFISSDCYGKLIKLNVAMGS